MAEQLFQLGQSVLGIDRDGQRVQAVADRITHAVEADAADVEALKALGIRNFDIVVVAIGNDMEASILITVILKELGVKEVVAKATSSTHGKVLEKVGADRVVYPERDMGTRVAHSLVTPNILDIIDLSPNVSIVELSPDEGMVGRNLRDLDLRARHRVTVLAIKKDNVVRISPGGEDVVEAGDILVVIGEKKDLSRLRGAD